jgi:predicted ester cyclase
MTPEERELPHRSHYDWLTKGNNDVVDEIYVEDCRIISANVPPELSYGREAFKAYANFLRGAFPDLQITDDEIIYEGELASIRWSFIGTHLGPMGNIPATGRRVSISGFDIMRIRDGYILELYLEQDMFGLLSQLGVFDQPQK